MTKKSKDPERNGSRASIVKSRKAIERTATFGLILIAVGLLAPFTNLADTSYLHFFKWVYAAGAFVFTVARIVGSTDDADSMRIRRLRRLEFWAGIAFCIGAFFWFYNENRFEFYLNLGMGSLSCLRDTVYFTLAGAVIQVLAVVLLSKRLKKEGKTNE